MNVANFDVVIRLLIWISFTISWLYVVYVKIHIGKESRINNITEQIW
jgi:hypothetical protein